MTRVTPEATFAKDWPNLSEFLAPFDMILHGAASGVNTAATYNANFK